jgi:hypothetical protein
MKSVYKELAKYVKNSLNFPLSIRREKVAPDLFGYARLKDGKFEIVIDTGISDQTAVLVLIHEVAHILDSCKNNHGTEWGKAYGKAYKIYEKFLKDYDDR